MLARTLDGPRPAPGNAAAATLDATLARRLAALLRVGMAMCFIGHGAFGLLRKEAWLPYFALFGFDAATAHTIMPIVGTADILVGLAVLIRPLPVLLAYGAAWCAWTALLRPLAGEGAWEALERAGNYGVPLALLVFAGPLRTRADWFSPVRTGTLNPARSLALGRVLQAATAMLLAGHGGLLLAARKPLFLEHWAFLGVSGPLAAWIGAAEMALACAVVLRPSAALFGGIALWKISTEALFPLTGAPLWEWIERGGSYAAPLAAMLLAARTSGPGLGGTGGRTRPLRVRMTTSLIGALVFALPAAAEAQIRRPDAGVLVQLREGGFVLACRHAITNHDQQDRNVDFDDPRTQRILSEEGERQARELGEILARLAIPIGDVLTSPYQRTRRSAELTFGRATVEDALYHAGTKERRKELLEAAVPPGTNRVLMTHQGVLYGSLTVEPRSIGEGDCVIVKPQGTSFTIVAQARLEDWLSLAN